MSKIFGAQAKVFMRYEGGIEALSKVISKGLILPDFSVESREDPPYDLTGSGETLGFEIWLNETNLIPGYSFVIEMRTEISNDELSLGQMHDLSLWLGRFISKICDIDTCVLDDEDGHVFFKAKES